MLHKKWKVLLVLSVTPLLLSPLARQQAARGLASVGVVTPSFSFSSNDPAGQLAADPELRRSYEHYSLVFGQASLDYLQGLQAARAGYGVAGRIYTEPTPLHMQAIDLHSPGFFETTIWQNFAAPRGVIAGNAIGAKAPSAAVPRTPLTWIAPPGYQTAR